MKTQHNAAKVVPLSVHRVCGRAPMLEMSRSLNPLEPKAYRHDLSDQFGSRVTPIRVDDASHALFHEQPDRVARAVLSWLSRLREAAAKGRDWV